MQQGGAAPTPIGPATPARVPAMIPAETDLVAEYRCLSWRPAKLFGLPPRWFSAGGPDEEDIRIRANAREPMSSNRNGTIKAKTGARKLRRPFSCKRRRAVARDQNRLSVGPSDDLPGNQSRSKVRKQRDDPRKGDGLPPLFSMVDEAPPPFDPLLGASGRSPAKKLSMVKRRGRAHGRCRALHLGWFDSGCRSVWGCVSRELDGEAGRQPAGA